MPIGRRTRATFVIYRSRTLKPVTPRCPITSATGCCPRAASGPVADDYSRDLRAAKWVPSHSAYQQISKPNARFGSKADIGGRRANVRFTPKADMDGAGCNVRFVPKADIRRLIRIAISSTRPNEAEMISRCASTVQSLAFRQALQVFGIGGGSAPIRKEKSPRGATSPPSQ